MIKGLLVRHPGLRQPSIARRATDGPRIVYKILDAFCWTAELTRMTEGGGLTGGAGDWSGGGFLRIIGGSGKISLI